MSQRQTYTVEVAGLTRHLPLFEVAPGVRIAVRQSESLLRHACFPVAGRQCDSGGFYQGKCGS